MNNDSTGRIRLAIATTNSLSLDEVVSLALQMLMIRYESDDEYFQEESDTFEVEVNKLIEIEQTEEETKEGE
tara:strand:- start:119 stop:334 length:216 start_codon:yes stop_codon:yes gene_type:complete